MGGGIVLAILALFLYGLGVVDTNVALSILLVGLALIVIGIGAWLYLLKPWKSFDDLTTPHYTGHEHDDGHAPHAEAEVEASAALPAPGAVPPVAAKTAPPAAPEPEPAAPDTEPAAKSAVQADEAAQAPALAAEPEPAAQVEPEPDAEPDDLTVIEGVGRKSAEALAASGVRTYKAMASKTPQELEDAVKAQKVRLVGSTETWPMQAGLAAAGDFEALDALKTRIKGGYLHDDLTQIEGIGPKAQEALYEAGLRSYANVAAANVDALREVLEKNPRLKLLVPDTWPQQAALLAKGDLDGLKALQDQLKGGRA